MTNLTLEIHRVKCIDLTGKGGVPIIGSILESRPDKMKMAGIKIDAGGRSTPANGFKVHNFTKDGEVKSFADPVAFATFNLQGGPPFPRLYQVAMILAELDEGGGLTDTVEKVIKKSNLKHLQDAAEGAVATAVASIAPVVGTFIFNEAMSALKNALKDDLFPPIMETLRITGENFRFPNGTRASDMKTSAVKAANGKYEVTHRWRIV